MYPHKARGRGSSSSAHHRSTPIIQKQELQCCRAGIHYHLNILLQEEQADTMPSLWSASGEKQSGLWLVTRALSPGLWAWGSTATYHTVQVSAGVSHSSENSFHWLKQNHIGGLWSDMSWEVHYRHSTNSGNLSTKWLLKHTTQARSLASTVCSFLTVKTTEYFYIY